MNLAVAFVLLPEFTLSAFAGFVDALRIAADEVDRSRQRHCRWTILGPERTPVRSSCGVEITPWETFRDPSDFDYTVVIGGLVRGYKRTDQRILSYLRQASEYDGALVGICFGSFALARAGLMNGHVCCVHWAHVDEFKKEFPNHRVESDVVYVVDRKRITCGGGQSAVDVAVHLIERHCGRGLALKVARGMLIETTRAAEHPQPLPEAKWFGEINSQVVQRAILLMEQQSPGQHVVICDIAARLGISTKTLTRAFQKAFELSPSAFLRILRMSHGRWDVMNTKKPIASLAWEYDFSDASHFTRLFRKYYGTTPAQARAKRDAGTLVASAMPGDRRRQTLMEEILWADRCSFAATDWPSDKADSRKPRSAVATSRVLKGVGARTH
ncbi:MAG: GlxA family transcriptional regulator [Luteimonas sp.]